MNRGRFVVVCTAPIFNYLLNAIEINAMKYDLTDEHDKKRFKARCNKLYQSGAKVVLTDETNRTLSQNSYLHLIIAAFAIETGYPMEVVKRSFYKLECNKDLYLRSKAGQLGEHKYLRSSKDLSKDEMSTSIDRFLTWASNMGYPLPLIDDIKTLDKVEIEYYKLKKFM